ncbi:MAG: class I SAM-dependent methyltransferase [Gammaproteobacteria bacterium]
MNKREHWERAYVTRPIDRLGWYEPHLQPSLNWIKELGLPADTPMIDVGGGASTLVDDLLNEGYQAITVLDISGNALDVVKARLGKKADLVTWREGDITTVALPGHHYALWHDRAVFHFLTVPELQQAYRDQLLYALQPGGHVIMGTFAPEAPPTCSGLPVQRYSPQRLESILGAEFELLRHHKMLHVTPGGVEQMYLYCRFRRSEPPAHAARASRGHE